MELEAVGDGLLIDIFGSNVLLNSRVLRGNMRSLRHCAVLVVGGPRGDESSPCPSNYPQRRQPRPSSRSQVAAQLTSTREHLLVQYIYIPQNRRFKRLLAAASS